MLVISGTATKPGHDPDRAAPDHDRGQGGEDREAHGDQGAEGDGQDDDRHEDADHLAVAGGLDVGVAQPTVVLDLDTSVAQLLDSGLRCVELLDADLLGVVADRRERGLPVLTEGRSPRVVGAVDGDHVRIVGQLRDGLVDSGLRPRVRQALVGVEDDVGGVEGLLREPRLDGVGRSLRLGTRKAEALVGLAAAGHVDHERGRGDGHPGTITRHGWRPAKFPIRYRR